MDLFDHDSPDRWEILNANYKRWGSDIYPSEEAARAELRDFWRGVSGVRLDRFTIQRVGA